MKNKICKICKTQIGSNSKKLLCEKHRIEEWIRNNPDKSRAIKTRYVRNNPVNRKVSWTRYNQNHKDRRFISFQKWYDNKFFDGKRLILIKLHPYCSRCGATESLDVHHRDGNGLTSKNPNNEWSNLVVLCSSCHKTVHERKERPYYVSA